MNKQPESDLFIIKYNPKHKKVLEKFMEGLQDYLVSTDYLKVLNRPEEYGKKYVKFLLQEIKKNHGVIFLAKTSDQIVGCIAGIIDPLPASERLGHKRKLHSARVLELYIDPDYRGKRLGTLLMNTIEQYFIDKKCDQIKVEVYAPNQNAHAFYVRHGYENESIDLIKKLKS